MAGHDEHHPERARARDIEAAGRLTWSIGPWVVAMDVSIAVQATIRLVSDVYRAHGITNRTELRCEGWGSDVGREGGPGLVTTNRRYAEQFDRRMDQRILERLAKSGYLETLTGSELELVDSR